jgi:hypothetical protein
MSLKYDCRGLTYKKMSKKVSDFNNDEMTDEKGVSDDLLKGAAPNPTGYVKPYTLEFHSNTGKGLLHLNNNKKTEMLATMKAMSKGKGIDKKKIFLKL